MDDVKRAKDRDELIASLAKEKDMKQDAKDRALELFDLETVNEKENETRTGKGTRLRAGMTRGKGSLVIKYEAFDESKPDTLPASPKEFLEITKANEKEFMGYLIVGYNDAMYTAASDPIAEHVNPAWDDDTKSQFRLAVRNYSKATGDSIDTVANMFKPGIEKKFAASQNK